MVPGDQKAESAMEIEARALSTAFRGLAERWAVGVTDAARILQVDDDVAALLLEPGRAVRLPACAETRLRIVIEIDRALSRAIPQSFVALAWLRLGSTPRLARIRGDIAELRSVRREAEGLAA
jgi:hypothetical protein